MLNPIATQVSEHASSHLSGLSESPARRVELMKTSKHVELTRFRSMLIHFVCFVLFFFVVVCLFLHVF